MSESICRRKTDGAFFEPSYPDDYNEGRAIADALIGGPQFYFRRVILAPRCWWQRCRQWRRTGEVWRPKSGEFDVLPDSRARQFAAAEPSWRYVPEESQP